MDQTNTSAAQPVGAVLVIGGGIGGIQAALDLADSGQKVYLLERSPAIGGNMARLDKTFPTNDCSMCILSPKVVECGRHLNIEIRTWSELEGISGTPGDFTVRIRRRARYVDLAKCTGCGECVAVCPVERPNEFDAALGTRKAIFRPYPQAYPNAFTVEKMGQAPCRAGCPAGINVNAYVALTAVGKFDEALDVILRAVPLPGVLGRVCEHPCESRCRLGTLAEPISICAIKRFLADRARGIGRPKPTRTTQTLEPVAIIGAGPAGLAAARELARKGYQPTIFEATSRPGGMLTWAIPEYRLPRDVLNEEIQDVLDEGIVLKTNCRLGKDLTLRSLREQGFAAIVLAIGAQAGVRLGIPDEDAQGVYDALAFLRAVCEGKSPVLGREVVVIGGGNSAMDAARTALRLGAEKVLVVYRRTRAEMPAIPSEIEAAEQEGVQFVFLAAPTRLLTQDGRVRAVECVRMRLGDPDASGRRAPVPIPNSTFTIETDTVIAAVGQRVRIPEDPDLSQLRTRRDGTIAVGPADGATSIPGVFAIGDAATGPRNVIEAIAEGKKVAEVVDCYLRGKSTTSSAGRKRDQLDTAPPQAESPTRPLPRELQPELQPAVRKRGFAEVVAGFTEEQAVKEANRCLRCAVCSECELCVAVCKAKAISHDQQDTIEEIRVGAIVLAPGFEEFSSRPLLHELGYDRHADVITSMEFERMLSASGPFGGHLRRPSDGREPRRIAFLQCVGSRDISCRNGYCSSVCCMYAMKEAVIAREHSPSVEATILFMDLRAFGKDFEKYYERARRDYGVNFVRARVSEVFGINGHLELRYVDESGTQKTESFDLVILSVGLTLSRHQRELARNLCLQLTPEGFVWTDPANPVKTSRPGVFAAGPVSGPKDIPETVVQASAAACEASRLLAPARNTLTVEPEFPPERNVNSEPPRIGVFICHCGINIGGVVRVPELVQDALRLPHVVHAEDNLYTCSQDTQDHIRQIILEKGINRVVVASCSPRTHEPLFQQTLRQAGLNPHLFVMANIRDQCSWPHMAEPAAATQKALDLVRMAVAKAGLTVPLKTTTVPVIARGLVVGGGVAGMTAALALADLGYPVVLVERENALGGNLRDMYGELDHKGLSTLLADLVRRVQLHPAITVRLNSTVREVQGFVGNFRTTLTTGEEMQHGIVVLATGAREYRPTEFGFETNPQVITQKQLARLLVEEPRRVASLQRVVMIQCVGSRNPQQPWCSRVCCSRAVRNAIALKRQQPATDVLILYRDMRTYGLAERHYQLARELGVVFLRYEEEEPPVVSGADGKLTVRIRERLLNRTLALNCDLVVLSTGIVPDRTENERLARLFKVPLNEDGFFLEAHAKLRPVEFTTEGVYFAGLAHAPKNVQETIAQALAAASRAATVLSRKEIETPATIAEVWPERCTACSLCEAICSYHAISVELQFYGRIQRRFAKVNPALCKG
ncbi:MAG: FAD-dependent oxidoreductase, partial [Kiritimatiellia bacterium]